MRNAQLCLDPKDLVVVVKIALCSEDALTYQRIASDLGLSASQVHASVGRLMAAGLLVGKGLKGKVNRTALAEFLHGAKWAFPAVLGAPCRGILAGGSSPLFEPGLLSPEGAPPLVWPSSKGAARGTSLTPLHPCVPKAAAMDPDLHQVLVYFDALRTGKARERAAAETFLRKKLGWSKPLPE